MTSEPTPSGNAGETSSPAGEQPAIAVAETAGEAMVTSGEEDAGGPSTAPAQPAAALPRRTFVLRALGAMGAAMAAVVAVPVAGMAAAPARGSLRFPVLAGSVPPTPRTTGFVNLGPLDTFPVGQPTLMPVTVPVTIGGVEQEAQIAVYVVRPHDQSVVILDIHCTHMGCPVGWSQGAKRFLCPCHGGAFTADGVNVAGPPPRPLDRYQAIIANQEVWMGPLIESD